MDKRLIETACRYPETQPVTKAWVFGSVSRGEQTPDIDIMVAFDKSAHIGLFRYAKMYTDLKELLGKEVDLVQEGVLQTYAAATANNDRILIYEKA